MNKVLKQFLIAYGVIFLLSVSAAFLLRGRAVEAMERKCVDIARTQMARLCEKLDALFDDALRIGAQLSFDADILALARCSNPLEEPAAQIHALDACSLLQTVSTFNERYVDIFFCGAESGLVVTTKYVFLDYERFYHDFFECGDMDAAAWRALVLDSTYTRRVFPAAETRTYTSYAKPKAARRAVTLSISLSNGDGKLVLLIPESSFPLSPEDLIPGYDCRFRIRGCDGELILGDDEATKETDMTLRADSAELGMTYELIVSSASFRRDLAGFGQILATMIISQILLLLALGALTAWRNILPARSLLAALAPAVRVSPAKADYQAMCGQVSALVERNAQLSSQLTGQTPIVESWLTLDWLHGHFANEAELEAAFARMRLSLPSALCWGLLIIGFPCRDRARANRFRDVSSALEAAMLMLRRMKNARLWFAQTDSAHIAVLRGYEAGGEDAAQAETQALKEALSEFLPDACVFAFRLAVRPGEMSECVAALCEQTEYRSSADGPRLRYSLSAEERLINAVCEGNEQEVIATMRRLESENASPTLQAALCDALTRTRGRILDELGLSQEADDAIEASLDDASPFAWFAVASRSMRNANAQSDGGHSSQPIVMYILEHYDDKNMSLSLLSSRFGVSEAYLSRCFKLDSGYNYAAFLEKVRIEHACELLNGDATVESVADQVGYNSVHVFRSAFKRAMGVTPSQFRSVAQS